jgi:hypothetical protein
VWWPAGAKVRPEHAWYVLRSADFSGSHTADHYEEPNAKDTEDRPSGLL